MNEQILSLIAQLPTPGFFIIVDFSRMGKEMPSLLEPFIFDKLREIREGAKSRKFVFKQDDWRMICTFFPTDRVVEDRYALKNKVLKRG